MNKDELQKFEDQINSDPELKKNMVKLFKTLVPEFILSLYQDGLLNENDIQNREKMFAKISKLFKKYNFSGAVIDHSESLIKNALDYKKKNDFKNAKLFYSIFFEHSLNQIILVFCEKKNFDKKQINEIIRSSNNKDKLTWLPVLLGAPKIKDSHVKTILKLYEDRNAYVHYKYTVEPELSSEEQKKEELLNNSQFIEIQKSVLYFRQYLSRIKYNRRKGHIKKLLKK